MSQATNRATSIRVTNTLTLSQRSAQLWRVQDGAATRKREPRALDALDAAYYGSDWILVVAPNSERALKLAAQYDASAAIDLRCKGTEGADLPALIEVRP